MGSLLVPDAFGSFVPLWFSPPALAMLFATLSRGILLGWGVAVPLGPVNVEIARRTLRGGFRAGFFLGMGASGRYRIDTVGHFYSPRCHERAVR